MLTFWYQLILEQKMDQKRSCDLTDGFIMLMILYQSILEQKIDKKRSCDLTDRKWQDYVYIQCEYKSTKQKIKHLLREENKVKENKIS